MLSARLELDVADAETLAPLVESLVRNNTKWYLSQWADGKDPDCCVHCAGCRWLPDGRRLSHRFTPASRVLERPKHGWSCKELAAVDCGFKRANEIRYGLDPETAKQLYRVVLLELPSGEYHAVVEFPDGTLKDPTEGLTR